jgi:hypothetical protein
LGYYAGQTITTGTNNVLLGYQSNSSGANVSNEIVIGAEAIGAGSNTVQLGNSSINNVKTSGTITAGAITIPNTDGTTGQILNTDGNGTISWVDVPTGADGADGAQGPVGPVGPDGPAGPAGDIGVQGDKGDTGDTGIQGIQGPAGTGSSNSGSGTVQYLAKIEYTSTNAIPNVVTNESFVDPSGTGIYTISGATYSIVNPNSGIFRGSFSFSNETRPPISVVCYGYNPGSANDGSGQEYRITHLDGGTSNKSFNIKSVTEISNSLGVIETNLFTDFGQAVIEIDLDQSLFEVQGQAWNGDMSNGFAPRNGHLFIIFTFNT